jgi:uncharacterized protein involved in copper resistance
MRLARQITALWLLFVWCFATGHLWTSHAGEHPLEAAQETAHVHHAHEGHHHHDDEDHHGDPETPAESHHHHQIDAAARVVAGDAMVVHAPLVAILWMEVIQAASQCDRSIEPHAFESPPDERRSGYLFVVQTAHPVRGPSLVA